MTEQSTDALRDQMIALLPNLRAFAGSLCRNSDYADDLVQQTLLKAWNKLASFHAGTNLKAWLFAILRNTFLSDVRRNKYAVADPTGKIQTSLSSREGQQSHMDLMDFSDAFERIPLEQREALILVVAERLSYDEVSIMCGCAIGTIKSRINRGRARLCELMGIEGARDFGPDWMEQNAGRDVTPSDARRR
jgi:RNA polymerase sigma-70 factor, ECF subfamily